MKKRRVPWLLTGGLLLILAGCRTWNGAITLPEAEEISAVRVERMDGKETRYEDGESVRRIVDALSSGTATDRRSVQDVPQAKRYGTVYLENHGGTTVAFYYEEHGSWFVEQPYQGIYKVEEDLEGMLSGRKKAGLRGACGTEEKRSAEEAVSAMGSMERKH